MCLYSIPEPMTSAIYCRIPNIAFYRLFPVTNLKLTRDAEFFMCLGPVIRSGSLPNLSTSMSPISSWLLSIWFHIPWFNRPVPSATSVIFFQKIHNAFLLKPLILNCFSRKSLSPSLVSGPEDVFKIKTIL